MRRLEWAKEFSKSCDSNKDGANKGVDSALNAVMTGTICFCCRTSCGTGICPADDTWLPTRIPSTTMNHMCVTRFLCRLILAFHHRGEETDPPCLQIPIAITVS